MHSVGVFSIRSLRTRHHAERSRFREGRTTSWSFIWHCLQSWTMTVWRCWLYKGSSYVVPYTRSEIETSGPTHNVRLLAYCGVMQADRGLHDNSAILSLLYCRFVGCDIFMQALACRQSGSAGRVEILRLSIIKSVHSFATLHLHKKVIGKELSAPCYHSARDPVSARRVEHDFQTI